MLILGSTAEKHLDNLRQVFERFRQYGLKFKPKKCYFFREKVEFLGRFVSSTSAEVEMGGQYIDAVREALERFLGFANFHRNFIASFSEIAAPLYAVIGKASFRWGRGGGKLAIPTTDGDFVLDTLAGS